MNDTTHDDYSDNAALDPNLVDDVLTQLDLRRNETTSWANALGLLAVSLVLYTSVGGPGGEWASLWLFIPILLFHELGHYLAMRVFGYRNLKMFFIPFLGAGVSGQHYNVQGWKKSVVALMGPVPGIVLGGAIGIAGMTMHNDLLIKIGTMSLFINGFNLIPFMPFDGGWSLHSILFCRHPLLDMAFRAAAILILLVLGLASWIFWLMAAFSLLGLFAAWPVTQAAHRLRERGGVSASLDDEIPPQTVRTILLELGAQKPPTRAPNILAQQVISVFDVLNSRPPGILATLALLAVHGISFAAALILFVVLTIAQGTPQPAIEMHPYFPGTAREWIGPAAKQPTSIAIATFDHSGIATDVFGDLAAELPPRSSMVLFGQSLLVSLPDGPNDEAADVLARLKRRSPTALIHKAANPVTFTLESASIDDAHAKELEARLNGVLRFDVSERLMPPWSSEWQKLPDKDRATFEKARRTFVGLKEIQIRVVGDLAVDRDRKGQKDKGEKDDFAKRRRALEKQLAAPLFDDPDLDSEVLRLWIDRPESLGEPQKWDDYFASMARLLGRSSKIEPRENVVHGRVTRDGRRVTVHDVAFVDPTVGLPALANWLSDPGALPMRYGYRPPVDLLPPAKR